MGLRMEDSLTLASWGTYVFFEEVFGSYPQALWEKLEAAEDPVEFTQALHGTGKTPAARHTVYYSQCWEGFSPHNPAFLSQLLSCTM